MQFSFSIIIILHQMLQLAGTAKVLGVFSYPSRSHQNVFTNICKELSLKGHQVTVITTDPLKDKNSVNLTEIDVSNMYNAMAERDFHEVFSSERFVIAQLFEKETVQIFFTDEIMNTKEVKDLMDNKDEHFDLLLVEAHNPVMFAFGEKFKIPIIAISSLTVTFDIYDAFGNPTHPFLSTHMLSTAMGSADATFYEKIKGLFLNIWCRILFEFYTVPLTDRVIKKYFGDDMPSIKEIYSRLSLLLTNANLVVDSVRADVPAIINFEFAHIKKRKRLPEDIQNFLDSSENGTVYFSFGTNVIWKHINNSTLTFIIKALGNLPFKVLWKYDGYDIPGLPSNVMTRKWFPQQDVLAHPKIIVFITQGGLQSLEESIFYGVPMIGIPFIADQFKNVKRMEYWKMGIWLDYNTLTADTLEKAVMEIVTNSNFKENVLKCKSYLEDQPIYGVEKAVWWIEYVLRHDGAYHLRHPAADMPFYKYFMIDVFLVLLVITLFSIFMFKFIHLSKQLYLTFKNKLKTE